MLKDLIEKFADRLELPIEVSELAAEAIKISAQDEIHFFPVVADPAQIRGAFVQYRYRQGVYSDSVWVTHIPYCEGEDIAWQRVICAKELVHLFDSEIERTDTAEEIPEFMEKLLGPLSTEDYGLADLMANKDRLALYQSLPLLMPKAALVAARKAVQAGQKTPQDIAHWAVMPLPLVSLMLHEHWETINGALEVVIGSANSTE